jgi:uncharacterized protein YecE (DUF72 family)
MAAQQHCSHVSTIPGSAHCTSSGHLRQPALYVGCAGWNVPRSLASGFAETGTHLERYASVYSAVEINSSFYRPHRHTTYQRWASAVPAGFRFSVKCPREITHERRLQEVERSLQLFVEQTAELGHNLGCYLVQLPPSLAFEASIADQFFGAFCALTTTPKVCEPRHSSWAGETALELLHKHRVGLVDADPIAVPFRPSAGSSDGLYYIRLHGSPRMYYSAYDPSQLADWCGKIRTAQAFGQEVWCIFDNTARDAAAENALQLMSLLSQPGSNSAEPHHGDPSPPTRP